MSTVAFAVQKPPALPVIVSIHGFSGPLSVATQPANVEVKIVNYHCMTTIIIEDVPQSGVRVVVKSGDKTVVDGVLFPGSFLDIYAPAPSCKKPPHAL